MIEALIFVLAAAAAIYLLMPLYRRLPTPAPDPQANLLAARAVALRAIHDLDLDWATGKLSEEDYREQRAALEAEAAAIARQLRAEEGAMPKEEPPSP